MKVKSISHPGKSEKEIQIKPSWNNDKVKSISHLGKVKVFLKKVKSHCKVKVFFQECCSLKS